MKTRLFFTLFAITILFSSCKQTKQARNVATVFYENLLRSDYDGAIALIHSDALQITPKEDWVKIFEAKDAVGEMTRFEPGFGSNTQITNGRTTVTFSYETTYGNTEFIDDLIIKDEGSDLKIYGYSSRKK